MSGRENMRRNARRTDDMQLSVFINPNKSIGVQLVNGRLTESVSEQVISGTIYRFLQGTFRADRSSVLVYVGSTGCLV